MQWFKAPPKVYFKRGATDLALRILKGKKRAFIVTDRYLFNSGAIYNVTSILDELDIDFQIFFDIKPDPTMEIIEDAMAILKPYEPDLIIALGGGSPIDTAKFLWLLYEQPDVDLSEITLKFVDIENGINKIPALGNKASLVCIPTTSGSGSEVTPFTIIKDNEKKIKYAIADQSLTPNIAIVDPNFVDSMPKGLTSASGMDALVHALEAYVSCMSTNFTNSNALEATKLIFRYLERSYNEGKNDPLAREKMHYASTIAGLAFANSFIGICHPMAHQLSAAFNMPHGVSKALLLRQIIKYNSKELLKYNTDSFASAHSVKAKYGQVADELGLGGNNDDEKIELLIKAIDNLMTSIQLPKSLKSLGIKEEVFMEKVDELTNSITSIVEKCIKPYDNFAQDIKQIYIDVYNGNV